MNRDSKSKKEKAVSFKVSEKLYQSIFEQASDGFFVNNVQGGFIKVNQSGCDMLGYTREEILNLSMQDLIPPNSLNPLQLDELYSKKNLFNECRMRCKNGHLLPVETNVRMLADGILFCIVRDISRRKQEEKLLCTELAKCKETEKALQNTLAELTAIQKNVPIMMMMVDHDKRILKANKTVLLFAGRKKNEILSLTVGNALRCTHYLDAPQGCGFGSACKTCAVGLAISDTFATNKSKSNVEVWMTFIHNKSVKKRCLLISTAYLQIDNTEKVSVFAQDITEYKQADEAAREGGIRYQAIVEAFDGLIYICSQNYHIEFMNKQLIDRTGYDGTWGLCYKVLHDRDSICPWCVNDRVFQGNITRWEVQSPKDNHWYYVVDTPIYHTDGSVSKQAMILDITESKQVEEALRESEERYRLIAENTADTISVFDLNFKPIYISPSVQKLRGYTVQEAMNQSLDQIFMPESLKKVEQVFTGLVESEASRKANQAKTVLLELKLYRKDGSTIWAELIASIMRDNDLKPTGIITVSRDITERKQLEAENDHLTAQFYQAQKMESLGRLAGGISHDFNNLLSPIIGFIDFYLKELNPESAIYEDLTLARKAANQASNLTRQIMAFGRQQVLELNLLDLNTVINEFMEMLQFLTEEDIKLQTFFTPSLYTIKADKGQIEQVFMNLVINSRDAMSKGGTLIIETANVFLNEAYIKKHAGELVPGDYVMLTISDIGYGIDAETLKHIFDPFFTRKMNGTGLGLATVFGIIKQHQGHIGVFSEPGNGTSFKIYLPKSKETIKTASYKLKEPISNNSIETVLVVKDNKMVHKLVCETLEAYGYNVVEAQSPSECLERASSRKGIDLLLTDIIMPEMNGKEFYRKLIAIHPASKVMYLSDNTNDFKADHEILNSSIYLLQKPFMVNDFARKIREVLD